jgi:hypothetical protein
MSDERLSKETGRGSRAATRASTDRRGDDRHLSEDRDFEIFRNSFQQSALPNLPDIPGYHKCWVSTTDKRDTPEGRARLGYEYVTPEDIPGWEHLMVKDARFSTAVVSVAEMVAMKISATEYRKRMSFFHHYRPREEEQGIRDEIERKILEPARERGIRIAEGDEADQNW